MTIALKFSTLAFLAATLGGQAIRADAEPSPEPGPGPAGAIVAQTGSPPTRQEWKTAFDSSFSVSSSEKGDDGQTKFVACFEGAPPKCGLIAFATYDAFRRLTIFEPAASHLNRLGAHQYLHGYISVIDCRKPNVMLNPSYFSKGSWLFINRVAILADDQVVLDHELPQLLVKRENDSTGVYESSTWIASEAEIAGLQKAAGARKLAIRITGDRGYVTVSPADLKAARTDAIDLLKIRDAVDRATRGKIPATCT